MTALIFLAAGSGFGFSLPGPVQAQGADAASTVQGQVVDQESGRPLAEVAVSLASGPGGTPGAGTRITNAEGRFRFRSVPPGTYRIVATRIGYRERTDTLEVEAGSDLEMYLPLTVSPVPLAPITVEVTRHAPGPLDDFQDRRRTRPGTFIDREQIENRHPIYFSDLLRMVPGARVVPGRFSGSVVLLRGGCRPRLWVDGVPISSSPEGVDAIIQPLDVEAIEIYHASELPAEFGSSSCGAIIVWTRRGEPTGRAGSFWKRLALGLGFLTLGILLSR